jgi:hypothetical protein
VVSLFVPQYVSASPVYLVPCTALGRDCRPAPEALDFLAGGIEGACKDKERTGFQSCTKLYSKDINMRKGVKQNVPLHKTLRFEAMRLDFS